MSALLEFSDISGGYGGATIVRNISVTLRTGQVLAVLGRNGVGKTTLIKILTGHLALKQGKISFQNQDISDYPAHQRQQLGVSYAPQEQSVFDNLSIRENLILMQTLPDLSFCGPYFEKFPKLFKRLDQKAGTMSGGEKKTPILHPHTCRKQSARHSRRTLRRSAIRKH